MVKKLSVLGTENDSNFQAIVDFFKDSDVEITCINDIEDTKKYFSENKFDLCAIAGYTKIVDAKTLKMCHFINIHPSLLPAFKGKNAIERAFKHGVKVSGVTVHYVDTHGGKIIAQYPVIIDEMMSLSEFEAEIHKVERALYPPVIKSILEDKLFSFDMLLKSAGGCGCKGGGYCKNKTLE